MFQRPPPLIPTPLLFSTPEYPTLLLGPLLILFYYFSAKYMFIETSVPRSPGDKAHLVSTVFNKTGGRCFTFWYHMYGSNIGRLNVYVNTTSGRQLKWRLIGNQGNRWSNGQMDVGSTNGGYSVSFRYWLRY